MMNIRELLQTRPLLFDGAMGTYYNCLLYTSDAADD